MRQVLGNSTGAVVARVPRPVPGHGQVLVRVHYSLISVGTEIASLRPPPLISPEQSTVARATAYSRLASTYLGLAMRNPGKAIRRVGRIAHTTLGRMLPARADPPAATISVGEVRWRTGNAVRVEAGADGLLIETDASPNAYQLISEPIDIEDGLVMSATVRGEIHGGAIVIGVLDQAEERWLGTYRYPVGRIDDRLVIDPAGSHRVCLVIANDDASRTCKLLLSKLDVGLLPGRSDNLPQSELTQQGWNFGYSAAGQVLAVGEGVTGFVPGQMVACAGAGKANHADFVCVPSNLVVPVPANCSLIAAATTTVGTIALQGVRRASPQLGERICVLGLGLIGQMTVQMLRANGCRTIGMDLSEARVQRARSLGLDAGASDAGGLRNLIRDLTAEHGVDRTIITAATKSDAVINLAMEITRAKGTVVIVGDVGLGLERAPFYRREIDLLMSTSYGPGRYDRSYEEEGLDYPFAYVRWTLNRNMQAYLDLVATGRIDVDGLIDRIAAVDDAPAVYRDLCDEHGEPPLGVMLHYPDATLPTVDTPSDQRVSIRGHRPCPDGVIRYILVGAGAFGLSMLVPQMARCGDRYFLRGLVSRSGVQANNYARENRVEILASDLTEVLDDPDLDLVVIATRHNEHAAQVAKALRAGKHVFVEKPLALSWAELDEVEQTYSAIKQPPRLMVGFNRRFSPAIQKLSECLAGRRSPLMVSYRLNGGYIPRDSWIQDVQGGGRNLGEACHMYDVFRALVGSPVSAISAMSIAPGDLPYLRNDNFVATLTYADGSVCTLVYTALGPKSGLAKEHIEVFCDGEAYVIEDFRRLLRAGDAALLWESATPDKGHHEELRRFGDAIHSGGPSPIPFEEIIETSVVALYIEDLLHGRGPGDDES